MAHRPQFILREFAERELFRERVCFAVGAHRPTLIVRQGERQTVALHRISASLRVSSHSVAKNAHATIEYDR